MKAKKKQKPAAKQKAKPTTKPAADIALKPAPTKQPIGQPQHMPHFP